jgi:hypothetical protein
MNPSMEGSSRCQVDVLEEGQRLRWQQLRQAMHAMRLGTHELPDGYAVRFKPDPALFVQVAEWIAFERLCCPFLAFGLDWSVGDGVALRLSGGPGVKEFLAKEMRGT